MRHLKFVKSSTFTFSSVQFMISIVFSFSKGNLVHVFEKFVVLHKIASLIYVQNECPLFFTMILVKESGMASVHILFDDCDTTSMFSVQFMLF